MEFAGMTLTIRDAARREIQKDANALTQSPRHHAIKVERARTYFPIIEKVFEEERVPDDFKYLVLQESALIADAVSVSNAVGFWQFKDFTALEVGLRVDKEIDERLNIVSSTRGAARYIKKNNFFFNNWIYALQAYQMGAGGVLKTVGKNQNGLKNMEITSSTYWYVKKFLAHKVAFENDVKAPGQVKVLSYENRNKKRLSDIAKEVSVDEDELKQYNKWVKTSTIPDDRTYVVMIPVVGEGKEIILPPSAIPSASTSSAASPGVSASAASNKGVRTKINGIAAIKASAGETPAKLASRAGVDLSDFMKWNDISISDKVAADQYYLLGKKRGRADEAYHRVTSGENLWSISQQYGVKVKKLKRYNRISSDRDLKPGMTMWLSATKPKDSDKVVASADIVQVDNKQTFSWTANPDQVEPTASIKDVAIEPTPSIKVIAIDPTPANTNHVPVTTTNKEDLSDSVNVKGEKMESQVPVIADSPTIEVVVPPSPTKKEHIVRAGETLYGIAKQYNLAVMDLVSANNLNLQQGIKPGQVLKLEAIQTVDEEAVIAKKTIEMEHVVKSTDTLYSVARKYNVTIQDLMKWNGKKDFTLSVGEKLKILTK